MEQKTALEERWQKILPDKLMKELKKRDPNLMADKDSLGTCSVDSKTDDNTSLRGSIYGAAMPNVVPLESEEDSSARAGKARDNLLSEQSQTNNRVTPNIFKGREESRRYTNHSSDAD